MWPGLKPGSHFVLRIVTIGDFSDIGDIRVIGFILEYCHFCKKMTFLKIAYFCKISSNSLVYLYSPLLVDFLNQVQSSTTHNLNKLQFVHQELGVFKNCQKVVLLKYFTSVASAPVLPKCLRSILKSILHFFWCLQLFELSARWNYGRWKIKQPFPPSMQIFGLKKKKELW